MTSARAVVTDGNRVLLVQDPGGRQVQSGYCTSPASTQSRRGGPTRTLYFIQVVYAGSPGVHRPELKEADDYVLGSELVPVAEARELPLGSGQQVFLDAALDAHERRVR